MFLIEKSIRNACYLVQKRYHNRTTWHKFRYWWSPSFAVKWSLRSTQSSMCLFINDSNILLKVAAFLLAPMTLCSSSSASLFSLSALFPTALLIKSICNEKLSRRRNFKVNKRYLIYLLLASVHIQAWATNSLVDCYSCSFFCVSLKSCKNIGMSTIGWNTIS